MSDAPPTTPWPPTVPDNTASPYDTGHDLNDPQALLDRHQWLAKYSWLMGTHQGAVSYKYLDYYLDEFTVGGWVRNLG